MHQKFLLTKGTVMLVVGGIPRDALSTLGESLQPRGLLAKKRSQKSTYRGVRRAHTSAKKKVKMSCLGAK
jgi:hypothetical protein